MITPPVVPRSILVVDDSAFMRKLIAEMVGAHPGFRVIGFARDGVDAMAERQALARAVEELPPDQRIAVVLHFFLDLGAEQIAERTGARVGTVKSRLHYAIRALRAGRDASDRIEGGRQ